MSNRTVDIFNDNIVVRDVVDSSGLTVVDQSDIRAVEIISEGPRGPVGPRGRRDIVVLASRFI